MQMPEKEYRERIQQVYDALLHSLEDVDPDVAEGEASQGALTITFGDRTRCVLSAQPSVRQLWVALAHRGVAHHFNWDAGAGQWRDDKKPELEVLGLLEGVLSEKLGAPFKIEARG